MKINWIKIKNIIPQILAIAFIVFVIFYLPKLTMRQEDKESPSLINMGGQLTSVLPDINFHAYYWDFTVSHDNENAAIEAGLNKSNFLTVSDPQGSGEYVSLKLFKNGQSIFAKDFLYKGDAFFDNDNYLDIVYGIKGDTNCCPPAFVLERYRYNLGTRQMDLLDKKEYLTEELSNENDTTSANSVELLDFINKNKAPSFIY